MLPACSTISYGGPILEEEKNSDLQCKLSILQFVYIFDTKELLYQVKHVLTNTFKGNLSSPKANV